MTNQHEAMTVVGVVERIIEYKDGSKEVSEIKNTILRKGREALAKSLANSIGSTYDYFINRMLFGDGGTSGGTLKYVDTQRTGLFGITRASKPVISQIDPNIPSQVVFTSVLTFDDANGYALNEMALQMSNGDLYSMVTFADLNKTSSMQITFNWRLSFV
jgi:hypothetical protein